MVEHVAENFTGLQARILAVAPRLSRAEERVSRVLLADPGHASRLTITELALETSSSEATVVRTARSLGFSGYPALRLALAAAAIDTHAHETADGFIAGAIGPEDSLDLAVAKLCHLETQALSATASYLTGALLEPVVRSITEARRVDIYGVGISGLVAQDLWYKLLRIGVFGQAHTDFDHAMASAALLGPGDVAIAISHSGQTRDVLDPFRQAGQQGATTVAVTSQPRSSLRRLAQHVLISAARDEALRPGAMAGRTSQLLVCDAIFVGVAQRDHEASIRSLERTRVEQRHRRRPPAAPSVSG